MLYLSHRPPLFGTSMCLHTSVLLWVLMPTVGLLPYFLCPLGCLHTQDLPQKITPLRVASLTSSRQSYYHLSLYSLVFLTPFGGEALHSMNCYAASSWHSAWQSNDQSLWPTHIHSYKPLLCAEEASWAGLWVLQPTLT